MNTTLAPEPVDLYERRAKCLGYVWSLMSVDKLHRHWSFQTLDALFNPAFQHSQISLVFNASSEPVAYIVWAYLSSDVEQRLLSSGSIELHLSEWNEGSQLWILDMVVFPGYFESVVVEHTETFVPEGCSVRFPRQRRGRTEFREISAEGLVRMVRKLRRGRYAAVFPGGQETAVTD